MNAEELYREEVLDHWRAPRNRGRLPRPDVAAEDDNPVCGDRIRIELKLDEDRIEQIRFDGEGCVISQAAASMLTELVEGRRLDEVRTLANDTVLERFGGRLTPLRAKCALLALWVLKAAAEQYARSNRSPKYAGGRPDCLADSGRLRSVVPTGPRLLPDPTRS